MEGGCRGPGLTSGALRMVGPASAARPNDVQMNPSLHKPAQQAGAAQVINAPPNGPQGSYHIVVELSTTCTSTFPPSLNISSKHSA